MSGSWNAAPRRCLTCGSTHGEPANEGTQYWYWRILEHGCLGPFHSRACVSLFTMSGGVEFTLEEYRRIAFLRRVYRLDHGEQDSASVVVSGRDMGDESG